MLSSIKFTLPTFIKSAIDNGDRRIHILDRMKVEFANQRLALIRTDRAHELGLPVAVVKSCKEKLKFIDSAPDERTLRNWRSLKFKKLEGSEFMCPVCAYE